MPIYTPSDQNSDHGELTGLGDDDHPQYTTDAEAGALAAALVAAHDADTSVHGIADTTVLATDAEVAAAVAAHVDDTTDAHDAGAISYAGGTGMSATDVEAAIDELAIEKANAADVVADGDAAGGVLSGTYPNPGFAADMATQAELDAHTTDSSDAHAGSAITNTPAGGIAATTVQGAINELDTEKASLAGAVMDGDTAGGVLAGTYPSPSFAADMATQAELDAHISDTTDAHAGTAITNTPAGNIAATTVQAAINELDSEKAVAASAVMDGDTAGGVLAGTYPNPSFAADMATQAELDAHITDTTDAHDASAISVADAGSHFTATDVEAALDELFAAISGGGIPGTIFAAKGDILTASADDTPAILTVGSNGKVLSADSGEATGLKWVTPAAAGIAESLIDAKGDLIVGSADDTAIRKAVGTNDHVLTADSTASGGVKWAAPASVAPNGSAGGVLDGSYPNPGLAAGVAGAGLAETSDVLSVNVDSSTIEINSDTLRVKAGGIGTNEIATNGVGTAELTDACVTEAKLAKRRVQILVTDPAGDALTTGDGKAYFLVDDSLNGLNLIDIDAAVTTVSSSGIPTFQLANVTDSVDMLTTKVTIDASEFTSYTAATAAVIDGSHDDVATGDILRLDCDVAGTGAKGVIVVLTFGP